jgi:hypothetical protein
MGWISFPFDIKVLLKDPMKIAAFYREAAKAMFNAGLSDYYRNRRWFEPAIHYLHEAIKHMRAMVAFDIMTPEAKQKTIFVLLEMENFVMLVEKQAPRFVFILPGQDGGGSKFRA